MPERPAPSPAESGRGPVTGGTGANREVDDEIAVRRIVIVDDDDVVRIILTTSAEGDGQISLHDADGFTRATLTATQDVASLALNGRSGSGEATRVEVVALDPGDGDGAYVGVELVDRGNGVAGFSLHEGRPPQIWTAPD